MKLDLETILKTGRIIVPKKVFKIFQPFYHWLLAFFAALVYRFPSRKIFVLGVTGTKGKTSTIEIINAILQEAGYKTAVASGLRFKIDKESKKNEHKMTMPGRFFLQKFLAETVKSGCRYAILEMTSEGAVQYRHKFIRLSAMLFTNLAPEHIESHGSFENYRNAKLKFFKALENSRAPKKTIVVNADDSSASYFLNFNVEERIAYSLKNLKNYKIKKSGITFAFDKIVINSKLSGEFNLYNILAAISFAKTQNIGLGTIKWAIEKFSGIEGRMEAIDEGQDFKVTVDYAHTPDSLEKVYEIFQGSRKICVLGCAGGGRDRWKRREMGKIASKHCDQIILTNEDPYDENPMKIIQDIKNGVSTGRCEIISDRREAIRKALGYAKTGDAVIITGKGSEPWIMGPGGEKTKWDDREVCREELKKLQA